MIRILSICVLTIFTLVSCSSPNLSQNSSNTSFKNLPPINLNVSKIDVIEDYRPPLSPPNIEHVMSPSPASAIRNWLKNRLQAVGSERILEVHIVDASAVEKNLPSTGGVKGLFIVDQDKEYNARIEVELRIYSGTSLAEASTSATVTRSITIPENASVNYRKTAYKNMIDDMMVTLNAKLENNMRSYFSSYIEDL